ncbi:hypothetical protein PSHT_02972, partial [Puccinia striiformis]
MSRATYYNPCGTCSDKAFSSLTAQCGEELAMLLQEFLLLIPSRQDLSTETTIIEKCASRSLEGLTDELRSAAGEEHSIDVCDLFFRFTLDSFVQM